MTTKTTDESTRCGTECALTPEEANCLLAQGLLDCLSDICESAFGPEFLPNALNILVKS
jgi:hypothetical protein